MTVVLNPRVCGDLPQQTPETNTGMHMYNLRRYSQLMTCQCHVSNISSSGGSKIPV